jgi:predicted GNAT family N-acyltransferase
MIKVIQHLFLDRKTLSDIIEIKRLSWNYSMEDHLIWMQNNIRDDDYHFLLINDDKLVAYVNLVNVTVSTGDTLVAFIGVGNVCSRVKGLGYGKSLMIGLKNYLLANESRGILFCQESLVQFYSNYGWSTINNLYPVASVSTMVLNCNLESMNFEKIDRFF